MHREQIVPGIEVARGALDAAQAASLSVEIDKLWGELGQAYRDMDEYDFLATGPVQVSAVELGPILQQVVNICKVPDDATLGLNHYKPGAATYFHTDATERAIIAHPTGDGAFDFARFARKPFEAERSFMELKVHAGDIVFSSGRRILHRGRNLGATPRRNVVFFPPD